MARPRAHDAELRRRLVRRASRIVVQDGVRALSLRALAAAEGTSTAAIYSLFGSKDDLLDAVYLEAVEEFGAHGRSVPPSDDPVADIAAQGTAYVAWAEANPGLYGVVIGEALNGFRPSDDSHDAASELLRPLTDAVTRAFELGVFRHGDVHTVVAALWAAAHGLVYLRSQRLVRGEIDVEEALLAARRGWQ